MIKLLLFAVSFSLFACHSTSQSESSANETASKLQSTYTLIRDNLYQDANSRLYLKSKTMEHFESGEWIDVWISHVYCDPCPNDQNVDKEWELKDFVDVGSFHLSKSDEEQGGDVYEDKAHTYFHKWMADGGTVTVWGK